MKTVEQAASECGNAMCEKYGMPIDHAIPCEEAFLKGVEFGREGEIEEVESDTVQMKTRPIGLRFEDGGVTLEVQRETHDCDECYYDCGFFCAVNRDYAGACARAKREDKKSVIFKLVEP